RLADPGVQTHPHRDRPAGWPRLRRQASLRGEGGIEAGPGRGERRAECVADRLEDVTAGLLDRVPQDLVMAAQRSGHRVPLGLPEPSGAFHISEQQRHCPRRRHRGSPPSLAPTVAEDGGGPAFYPLVKLALVVISMLRMVSVWLPAATPISAGSRM